MKAHGKNLDKSSRSDKENVNVNIIKRISATNAKQSTEGPTKKTNAKTIGAMVTPVQNKKRPEETNKGKCAEEEVKLPIDDFVINGICAHKVKAAKKALAIINPPDMTKTQGIASPFSPLSDIQSYKASTRVEAVVRPTPHIIDFTTEIMEKQMKHKERRNDTLDCTWDKRKDKSSTSSNVLGEEEGEEKREVEEGDEENTVLRNCVECDPAQDALVAESALSEAKRANEDLQKALEEAKVKCARIDEVSAINENISRVAVGLRADRDGKAAEVNALQNKLQEAKDTIKLLQNQMASLDNLNSQLCEEMAANQTILENKSARLEEMQDIVIGASPIRSPLKDELEKYSRQLQTKEAEVNGLKRELETMTESVSEHRRAAHVATEELNVLQVRYDEVREQLHGHHSVHDEQQEEWKSRLHAKEMALEHAESELSTLRQNLATKEDELMTLLHSSVQSSDIATAKLQREKESLVAARAELETARERIALLTERDVSRGAELESLRASLTSEIKSLTSEKSELRQSCNGYRISLDSAKERMRSLEMAIQAGTVSMRSPAMNRDSAQNSPASDTFASPASSEGGVSDKARIAALESDLRMARDLLVQFNRSKSDKIASMEALLSALEIEEKEACRDGKDHANGDDDTVSTIATSKSQKLEKSLVAKFIKSEERCKALLIELTSTQEEHEKAQRTIKHLTEEFERSKELLEKQLSCSSSSTGELANKMCDMNEKVEQLMQYSLKLTEELHTSKEKEAHLAETVDSMHVQLEDVRRERDRLTSQLHDVTHQVDIMSTQDDIPPALGGEEKEQCSDDAEAAITYDLQALRRQISEKDGLLMEWQAKYTEMSSQMENAASTLEKAKQSKIKRYNKYLALQNEYKVVVAQVRRLLAENGELKARHKSFVRTVEQTLVGGEGKAALVETFSNAGQASMVMPTAGNFNDIAWVAPTPGQSDTDVTASTVPSYHGSGLHTGSTIASMVTPSDVLDMSSKPSVETGAIVFEDLAFESAGEE